VIAYNETEIVSEVRTMTTAEIVSALTQFNNAQRLEVIEAATRLIREELLGREVSWVVDDDRRLREAAARLADLYVPGGEMTEWNILDGEDVRDDYLPR
jgi:hypothetical protein